MKRHDHKKCGGHFRHDAFGKRLCYGNGNSEAEARAFADEIAAVIAAPHGRRPELDTARAPRETWANRPWRKAA